MSDVTSSVNYLCRVLSGIFCWGEGGQSILKKFFGATQQREKNFFRPSRGGGGCEKIVFGIG